MCGVVDWCKNDCFLPIIVECLVLFWICLGLAHNYHRRSNWVHWECTLYFNSSGTRFFSALPDIGIEWPGPAAGLVFTGNVLLVGSVVGLFTGLAVETVSIGGF